MAVDKVFSLGLLTITTHHKQLCPVHYVLYTLHIKMPKFGSASAPSTTELSKALMLCLKLLEMWFISILKTVRIYTASG